MKSRTNKKKQVTRKEILYAVINTGGGEGITGLPQKDIFEHPAMAREYAQFWNAMMPALDEKMYKVVEIEVRYKLPR